MKKRLTRGEKWLFASLLLFLVMAGVFWVQQQGAPLAIGLPPIEGAMALEFSPDGKRLVAFLEDDKTTSRRVYDLETRSQVCELATASVKTFGLPAKAGIWRIYQDPSWSSDGTRLVSQASIFTDTNSVDTFVVWDAQTGAVKSNVTYKPDSGNWRQRRLQFSGDDKYIIDGNSSPAVYNPNTGVRLNKPSDNVWKNSLTPNLQLGLVAIGDYNSTKFRLEDLKTKRVLWKPSLRRLDWMEWDSDVLSVKDSPQQKGSELGEDMLLLYDGKARQPLPLPPILPHRKIDYYSINSDGRTLAYFAYPASGTPQLKSDMGELVVWDYRANRVVWRYESKEKLTGIGWSPDGKWLTAIDLQNNRDYRLRVFDKVGTIQLQRTHLANIVAWSRDSKQLATVVPQKNLLKNILSSRLEIHSFEH